MLSSCQNSLQYLFWERMLGSDTYRLSLQSPPIPYRTGYGDGHEVPDTFQSRFLNGEFG